MKQQKRTVWVLAGALVLLAVVYFALIRPLAGREGGADTPKELLPGEAYYYYNGKPRTDMVLMYPQLTRQQVFQVTVHNAEDEDYLFYHHIGEKTNVFYIGQPDDGGQPVFYEPDIMDYFENFDYTTLYDDTAKIPTMLAATGMVVIKDRVYTWTEQTDPVEVQRQLKRYGLAEDADRPWFEISPVLTDLSGHYIYVYTDPLTGQTLPVYTDGTAYYHQEGVTVDPATGGLVYNDDFLFTGSRAALTVTYDHTGVRRVYVGRQTVDENGYYLMLEGRNVVYTTASSYVADVVFKGMGYYINPRLVTRSENTYASYYSPELSYSNGLLRSEAGSPVSAGGQVGLLYERLYDSGRTPPNSPLWDSPLSGGNLLWRTEEDGDLFNAALLAARVGDTLQLVRPLPLYRGVGTGQAVSYRIHEILGVVGAGSFDREGTVAPGSLVAVRYTDGSMVTTTDPGGQSHREELFLYGLFDLTRPDLPPALSAALVGQDCGPLAEPVDFTVGYDAPREGDNTLSYRILTIDAILRAGVTLPGGTVEVGDTVVFGYEYSVDGEQAGGGSMRLVIGEETDPVAQALSDALLGRSAGDMPLTVEGLLLCEDRAVQGFLLYEDARIEYTVSYELQLDFAFVNLSQRDMFYGDAIYRINGPADKRAYALDMSATDKAMAIFNDLSGTETVAVGLDAETFRRYGLHAYHLHYELPFGTRYVKDPLTGESTDDIEYDYTIGYDLYLSAPQDGYCYVGSTQYGVVVRAPAETFAFLGWDFLGSWVRNNLLLLSVENIATMVFDINYNDRQQTHSFFLAADPHYAYTSTYGQQGQPQTSTDLITRLYLMYVPGEMETETTLDHTGKTAVAPGVRVEQVGSTLQRVTRVLNGVDLDRIYHDAGVNETRNADKAGVLYFRRLAFMLYSTSYAGQAELDAAALAALRDDPAACVLTMTLTLVDGRQFRFAFSPYSARRALVAVSEYDADGTFVSDSAVFFLHTSEVKKIADTVAALSVGEVFDIDSTY